MGYLLFRDRIHLTTSTIFFVSLYKFHTHSPYREQQRAPLLYLQFFIHSPFANTPRVTGINCRPNETRAHQSTYAYRRPNEKLFSTSRNSIGEHASFNLSMRRDTIRSKLSESNSGTCSRDFSFVGPRNYFIRPTQRRRCTY